MMRDDGPVLRGNLNSNEHGYPLTAIGTSNGAEIGNSEELVMEDHDQQALEDGTPPKILVSRGWDVHYTSDGGEIKN